VVVAVIYEPSVICIKSKSRTFESTNLLMVAIISLCPSTSSSEAGRYFSTLETHE
jgi:hypothetical protein